MGATLTRIPLALTVAPTPPFGQQPSLLVRWSGLYKGLHRHLNDPAGAKYERAAHVRAYLAARQCKWLPQQ